MCTWQEIDFPAKHVATRFSCVAIVVSCCWNMDTCTVQSESSRSFKSRAVQINFSKHQQQTWRFQFSKDRHVVPMKNFLQPKAFNHDSAVALTLKISQQISKLQNDWFFSNGSASTLAWNQLLWRQQIFITSSEKQLKIPAQCSVGEIYTRQKTLFDTLLRKDFF